jgi:metallo-beta-lactamase family protein
MSNLFLRPKPPFTRLRSLLGAASCGLIGGAMKIHFFGAARTTTGSMYLIEVNGKKLLLECGLFQGHRAESELLNKILPFDTRLVDAVVLSHSHLDHAGKLPSLCKNYDGPIHCTSATRDLCGIMLLDSAHIQEQDAGRTALHHARRPEMRDTTRRA